MIPEKFQEKMKSLTQTEEYYFRMMWPKYGVLFIQAKPGVAKSAIGRSIADKMGFRYMDLRLSMADETDFKYPFLEDMKDGENSVKVSGYAVPKWAFDSNKQPTLIHFEELNRAPQFVRNAALQILLEREIGDFKFNDNVIMMASGNLGDEDGTDVEEFDSALNNRLIHVKHSLSPNDWFKNFADKNVHPTIVGYLKSHPEKMYVNPEQDTAAYATPRSWTMLSDFIVENYGMNSTARDFLGMVKEVSPSYIGTAARKYVQYCEDMMSISIQDVLDRYPQIKKDLERYNRDKKSELLQSLRDGVNLMKLNKKQLTNLQNFLKTIDDDELTGYLLHLIDNNHDVTEKRLKEFLLAFKDLLMKIDDINNR